MDVRVISKINNSAWAKILFGCLFILAELVALVLIWPGGFSDYLVPSFLLTICIVTLGIIRKWRLRLTILVLTLFFIVLIICVFFVRDYHYRHAWDGGVPTRIYNNSH